MSLLYGLMNLLLALWREFHVCQRVNRSDSRVAGAVSGAAFDVLVYSAERLFAFCSHIKEPRQELLAGSDISFTQIEYLLHRDYIEFEPHIWEN
jgi:hypothetical protein